MLDLGAGSGALTRPLVRAGAEVVAVELHPGRAAQLRERFADAPVRVIQTDLERLRLPRRPFRVVANPPYAVSTALLKQLLAKGSRLDAADLVLPVWVVARYANGRGHNAARWQSAYRTGRGLWLPRRAFAPPPPRDWGVLTVRRAAAR